VEGRFSGRDRVAIVEFRTAIIAIGCNMITSISNASEVTIMIKARFRSSRNLLRKSETAIPKRAPKLRGE
jgi:hypothetical protein